MSTGVRVFLGMLALAVLCTLGTFLGYKLGCDPVLHEAACQGDSMAWMRHEYHLSEAQFAAIQKLHEEYTDTCDEHCRKIRAAMKARETLQKNGPGDKAALLAADENISELSASCQAALRKHLERVAALMNPEDGCCYLATMIPLLERFDHSGTPDLRLTAPAHKHEH